MSKFNRPELRVGRRFRAKDGSSEFVILAVRPRSPRETTDAIIKVSAKLCKPGITVPIDMYLHDDCGYELVENA